MVTCYTIYKYKYIIVVAIDIVNHEHYNQQSMKKYVLVVRVAADI